MKKFNQLTKKKLLQIYLSSIKTKVTVKFPKKNFLSTENQLVVGRVNGSVDFPCSL